MNRSHIYLNSIIQDLGCVEIMSVKIGGYILWVSTFIFVGIMGGKIIPGYLDGIIPYDQFIFYCITLSLYAMLGLWGLWMAITFQPHITPLTWDQYFDDLPWHPEVEEK